MIGALKGMDKSIRKNAFEQKKISTNRPSNNWALTNCKSLHSYLLHSNTL